MVATHFHRAVIRRTTSSRRTPPGNRHRGRRCVRAREISVLLGTRRGARSVRLAALILAGQSLRQPGQRRPGPGRIPLRSLLSRPPRRRVPLPTDRCRSAGSAHTRSAARSGRARSRVTRPAWLPSTGRAGRAASYSWCTVRRPRSTVRPASTALRRPASRLGSVHRARPTGRSPGPWATLARMLLCTRRVARSTRKLLCAGRIARLSRAGAATRPRTTRREPWPTPGLLCPRTRRLLSTRHIPRPRGALPHAGCGAARSSTGGIALRSPRSTLRRSAPIALCACSRSIRTGATRALRTTGLITLPRGRRRPTGTSVLHARGIIGLTRQIPSPNHHRLVRTHRRLRRAVRLGDRLRCAGRRRGRIVTLAGRAGTGRLCCRVVLVGRVGHLCTPRSGSNVALCAQPNRHGREAVPSLARMAVATPGKQLRVGCASREHGAWGEHCGGPVGARRTLGAQ